MHRDASPHSQEMNSKQDTHSGHDEVGLSSGSEGDEAPRAKYESLGAGAARLRDRRERRASRDQGIRDRMLATIGSMPNVNREARKQVMQTEVQRTVREDGQIRPGAARELAIKMLSTKQREEVQGQMDSLTWLLDKPEVQRLLRE